MKQRQFSQEQIIGILHLADQGEQTVAAICRAQEYTNISGGLNPGKHVTRSHAKSRAHRASPTNIVPSRYIHVCLVFHAWRWLGALRGKSFP